MRRWHVCGTCLCGPRSSGEDGRSRYDLFMSKQTELTQVEVRELFRSGEARLLRKQAGLSLRRFAKLAGVAPSVAHNWESGRCLPNAATAERVAKALVLVGAS
jgi:DNA-binding transcriptional regulator YiaG